jgi:hypothetical protein
MRGINSAPLFNPAKGGEKFWRPNFINGALANPRKYIELKPPDNFA